MVLLHDKEAQLLAQLKQTHLAMVDAYVDKKILIFEDFFFNQYGPKFRKNWEAKFKEKHGRDFDIDKDFGAMYSDLVAIYQVKVQPIVQQKADLRDAITSAYDQVAQAHEAVGGWIKSVEHLNAAERSAMDKVLQSINPNLSLEGVEKKVTEVTDKIKAELKP